MTPYQEIVKNVAGVLVTPDVAEKMAREFTRNTRKRPFLPDHTFLDNLLVALDLRSDAALAREMEVEPPAISRIRHGKMPVGPSYIIKAHELTGWTIAEIRQMIGQEKKAA